jgi:membrane protein DedA with SNARE-associated domain
VATTPVHFYASVFLATLGTIVLPVPEEATLLAAGYLARTGSVEFPACVGAGLLAVIVGDAVSYVVGRLLLARLLRTRLGTRVLPESRRAWAEDFVSRRGGGAIVAARFLVGLRGFVYFAVGAARYPFGRFLAIDAAAGVVEVSALVGTGFAFGELRGRAGAWVDLVALSVLVAALVAPALARALTGRGRTAP